MYPSGCTDQKGVCNQLLLFLSIDEPHERHWEHCMSEVIQGIQPSLESFSTDQSRVEIAQDMTDNHYMKTYCVVSYVTFKDIEDVEYQRFI